MTEITGRRRRLVIGLLEAADEWEERGNGDLAAEIRSAACELISGAQSVTALGVTFTADTPRPRPHPAPKRKKAPASQ